MGLRARALLDMTRPPQLVLIAAVFAVGAAAARASFGVNVEAALLGLVALLLVSASVHLANEYADATTDALTTRTAFSGGSGALARTDLDPGIALRAAALFGVGGLALGAGASAFGLLPPVALWLLLVGMAGGWWYSLPGRHALSRRGLGEAANAALGGLLLPVYGFAAATGAVPAWVVLAFVPFALVDFANVVATAWPDRLADRLAGKLTLATRLSTASLRATHAAALAGALVITFVLVGRVMPPGVGAASLLVTPIGAIAVAGFTRRESPFWSVGTMVGLLAALMVGWALVPTGSWMARGA